MSEIVEALDAKAREYMKRIIQDMVEWRKREAELIARLVNRNTRRLQERLTRYKLTPRKVWSPRGVVEGGPVELSEGEPYALYQVWPKPSGFVDLFYDTVKLFDATKTTSEVTHDSNIVYREAKLTPSEDTGATVDLPKYPFFDNLAMSPAEMIEAVERYLSTIYVEVVLDVKAEYTNCSMREEGSYYHYYCKPSAISYVALQPGEYQPSIVGPVDFQWCIGGPGVACFYGFRYHGEYSGSNIIYWTSDSNRYIVSIHWYILDGGFTNATVGGQSYPVYTPATIILAEVVNEATPANVQFAALHAPGGVFVARYKATDQQSNWTYYAVAYWPGVKGAVKIIQQQ